MADVRPAPLSFRPVSRVARDEEFDESLFERVAGDAAPQPQHGEDEGGRRQPEREGLPASYRMRHDPHYVEQITSRRHAEPVHLVPVGQIDGPHPTTRLSDLQPLVDSIARVGVLQPLLVRRHNGRYHLIAGARRLAAAMAAGLSEVPCLVHAADEEGAARLAAAEAIRGGSSEGCGAEAPAAATRIPARALSEITEHLGAIDACLPLFGDRGRPLRESVAIGLIQAEIQQAAWLTRALSVIAEAPAMLRSDVELNTLVERLLDALAPERSLAGVAFEHEPTPTPCLVAGDEQLLAVAVAGMLTAVRALVERTEKARVAVRLLTDRGPRVCLEVSEHGLAPSAVWGARLFDLEWTDRPGGVRAGVGLVAAQRIVALHGGRLELLAQPDGCALVMTLPSGATAAAR